MLLASSIGLFWLPNLKRIELANDLEIYERTVNRQPAIRRRASFWLVQGQWLNFILSTILLIWLLGRYAGFFFLFRNGGLDYLIKKTAYWGIETSEWLFYFFKGP